MDIVEMVGVYGPVLYLLCFILRKQVLCRVRSSSGISSPRGSHGATRLDLMILVNSSSYPTPIKPSEASQSPAALCGQPPNPKPDGDDEATGQIQPSINQPAFHTLLVSRPGLVISGTPRGDRFISSGSGRGAVLYHTHGVSL